jgi:hypothetical protein
MVSGVRLIAKAVSAIVCLRDAEENIIKNFCSVNMKLDLAVKFVENSAMRRGEQDMAGPNA